MPTEDLKQMVSDNLKKLIYENGGFSVVGHRINLGGVYVALSLRCKRDIENVEINKKVLIGRNLYSFDIYIPNGIERLNIPKFSFIELKERLITDSIFRVKSLADKFSESYPGGRYFLLYKELGDVNASTVKTVAKNKLLEIIQIDEFLSKVEKTAKLHDALIYQERDWKQYRKQVIDNAKTFYREHECSLFLGAGVSQDAGGPSWNNLLFKILKHFNKDITKRDFSSILNACGNSSIMLGRYAVNNEVKKKLLTKYLRQYVLYHNLHNSELIAAICNTVENGGISSIFTYNYDDLIETALKNRGVAVASVYCKNRSFADELPIFHVHGLIPQKEEGIESMMVLSEMEYHKMYRDSFNWTNVEQLHALDRNTCFFIGMSMTDPNLRRLLDISREGGDGEPHHFVFLKREPLRRKNIDAELEKRHFDIIQSQYESLNIYVIWVEEYSEIPNLLREISTPMRLI